VLVGVAGALPPIHAAAS